jgi:hypothetical protein
MRESDKQKPPARNPIKTGRGGMGYRTMRWYDIQSDKSSPAPLAPSRWYRDDDLVRRLGVSRCELRRARREGKLQSRRWGLVHWTRGSVALAWWEATRGE